jgi:hypothetical protein
VVLVAAAIACGVATARSDPGDGHYAKVHASAVGRRLAQVDAGRQETVTGELFYADKLLGVLYARRR